ncbi:MAG: 3-deoxy-manno-octulosonate cytidylyltransferase [Pseudomonadota bacterium]
MKTHIVIPARRESVRLPNKPLLDIVGTPMIVRVLQRGEAADLGDVCVATDDAEIVDCVRAAGGTAEVTRDDHPSGTDRIAEVARRRGWPADDIVVNLQGDEPLMPPALLRQVAALLDATPRAGIATLATPIATREDFLNPNVVKVVSGADGLALYFSRAPIPHGRADAAAALAAARRHLGLYAYRVAVLERLVEASPTPLEQLEKLEQLRAFALGIPIAVTDAEVAPGPGVDTQADLDDVRRRIAAGDIWG